MKESEPAEEPVNEVRLRGRLAAAAVERDLPSGDVLVTFRVVVPRHGGEPGRVDSVECATTRARPSRTVLRAQPGAWLEVSGSLQRRFWRTPAGAASRYSVDVQTARTVSARSRPVGRRADASPAPMPASG